ncbi:MAG TPA: PHP domain-containing protein, partial [Dehalococcoidia bacterium]|nr:PHP domain-containing protein [Dehalococcoidia bacterium]
HNHTLPLSIDSGLRPQVLIDRARARALDGLCLTEHDRLWPPEDLDRLRDQTGFLILGGCEVTTQIGHVIAIGLREVKPGFHRLETLREAADRDGAVLIAAHPLRDGQRIAGHPDLLPLFDGIEVFNGTESAGHNDLAARLAIDLGRPGVGGSDAHVDHEVGPGATEFDDPVETEQDLIAALRAGRVRPVDLTLRDRG